MRRPQLVPRRLRGINAVDRHLVGRSAQLRPSSADTVLRSLTIAANANRVWIAVGTAAIVFGTGRQRRAGARGLVAAGIASALANGVAKPLFPRRRPPAEAVPLMRRLISPPVSSSFPSGHAASAAAFAVGVALESPAAAVAVAPVAAAVAYSRVHVGVHWPTDVLAGAALGAAVAVGTRRWWAVRRDEPALVGPVQRIEPVIGGDGLLLIANPQSGSGDGTSLLAELTRHVPRAVVVELGEDVDLDAEIDTRVRDGSARALGVLGGDGTVSAVAEAAVRHGLPLAVFPGGTLNHFARDIGADDIATTLTALTAGRVALADTARVRLDDGTERTVINTASLGGHPDFVRLRERWEHRVGKWPAAAVAMVRVLLRAQPLRTTIDGDRAAVWMLFVGNGTYRPGDQVPTARTDLHGAGLDIRFLRADRRFSRLRLIWASITGTLGDSPTYAHRHADKLRVRVEGAPVSLATDGEVDTRSASFDFVGGPSTLAIFRRDDSRG
ncbi:PAP2 superfamily protein [Nocardia nova SH22a]|uniref:PAP2 superfamily protein n=1 Tax=Nocardia nova SH22a TaxID=1415166 RepID=W5TGN8_9NOCA|nr:phosphatase PAP2 family protein [Nocardia nova]AHH16386.1 PAP2 superfamily protein [Nocardia nova SH22a]